MNKTLAMGISLLIGTVIGIILVITQATMGNNSDKSFHLPDLKSEEQIKAVNEMKKNSTDTKNAEQLEVINVYPDDWKVELKKGNNEFSLPVNPNLLPLFIPNENTSLLFDSNDAVIGVNLPTAKAEQKEEPTGRMIMKANAVKVIKVESAQEMGGYIYFGSVVTFSDGIGKNKFYADDNIVRYLKEGSTINIWYAPSDGIIRKVIPTAL